MDKHKMLTVLFISFWIKSVYTCTTEAVQYAKKGETVTLQFQARTVHPEILQLFVTNVIKSPNNSTLLTILYTNRATTTPNPTCNGCSFVGDTSTGDISIRLDNLQAVNGGTYKHSIVSPLETVKCITVYILGKPQKATVSHDNNNVLGRNSTLSCNSLSTTIPINQALILLYNWDVNKATNPSNTRYKYGASRKTLTIMYVTKEDANKSFKCSATESGDGVTGLTSDYSDKFLFTVIYGPDDSTTKLTPSSPTYTRSEGDSLNDIQCSGNCYPSCNYKWTKPGSNTAVNRATLSLGSLNRTEAGTYTCTVSNPTTGSEQTETVSIFVRYGPDAGSVKLNPVKATYTQNEGTRLNKITCSTACYPTCSYKWTKSGTNAVVNNTAVLTLGTLNKDKAATYTCTATNPEKSGTAATDVAVHVRYGPDICTTSLASPLTLTEGMSSPTISCESECYPSCSQTWSNVSSKSPVGQNGKFQLVKTTRYQAGNYKCFCKNTASVEYVKNQTAILRIIIQYPPDVNVSLSTDNITEGIPLDVSCDADGVPSNYSYNDLTQTWNGTPIPNTHTEVNGKPRYSSLHIPSLQLQDSGTYSCYVNNGVKTADTVSSVTVKVKVLPKIFSPLLQFAGKTDGTVNVSVRFYSFPGIEEVVFKQHGNQTITNDTDKKYIVSHYETMVNDKFYGKDVSLIGVQANLVISKLKPEDFGSYTLILKNEVGKTVTPFTVDAESAPSAPTGFIYLSKAGTHTFTWSGGFNGGKRQTFIIQTSIADEDNWQNKTIVTEEMESQNVVTYWATISSLSPGTYSARLFAWNVYGNSDYVDLNRTFTVKEIAVDETAFPVAAVIGGSLAGISVFAISAFSFFIYKRRYGNKDGSQSRLNKGHVTAEGDSDDEDEVNTVNPMYVSADEVKPGLSAENTYAQPVKKNKHDIYALVDKKPKNVQDDLNNLYATPEKKGKEKPQKKEGLKKDKKGRKKKAKDGDVYENAPENAGGTESRNAYDENPYENPEVSAAAQRPQKNVNKDGLIYADLTFNDPPKGQKKLVIHGLDSMTEYVQVDFTKKAEPLPESDEEK